MILNTVIEKDEDGYFAYVPSLSGCVSQGNTYEEALFNIKEASELYLDSMSSANIEKISAKNSIIAPIEIYAT